ncbi:unnamed protein product [Orchesella dallaii]|uniref:NADPH-dependent diflavin oxidoreductase 1 n=2 Tax=Orchesella dallaii TaxID=48710 RepID=A0ABP1Q4M9_9HEXA
MDAASSASVTRERSSADLLIAFGTTTGTARDVAHRIAREAYSFTFENSYTHYFRPQVLSMKEISVNYLITNWVDKNAMVIFVVSTTGQGEFPDDTKELWRELCGKSVSAVPIRFAAIGLGDSSYEMYNYPAKKLYNRLKQLSAISPFEVCLCDDQHDCGYAGALNPYLERCWRAWVPENCTTNPDSVPVARYNLVNIPVPGLQFNNQPWPTCDKLEQRMMIRNERVKDFDNFEDTRLIAFDTTNSNLNFQAGDVLQVFADNFPDNVQNFFKLYPQLRNQPPFYLVSVRSMRWVSIPAELFELCGPQPWTWEKVATKIFDFQSIPGVYAFQILRSFATDPLVIEKFDKYRRPEGLEDLYNYTNRPKRTILEVLLDFRNTAVLVPPKYLFELIPFMRPRAFSIASPPCETQHIEILVAVVDYKTNLKTRRRGTCSYWLAEYCQIGQKVGVFCEKGSLRPPPNDAHVIMIGPGTGVAPFRSMIMQNLDKWDKHLFFGCRNKNIDFNFGQEFNEMVEKGKLAFYHAVSRDSAGRKLEYVQDLIVKHPNLFSNMMLSPLPIYIYVCGRAGQMPKDVRAAIQTVFLKIGIKSTKHVISGMIEQGRYQKKQVGGTPKTESTQMDAAGSASVTTESSSADLLIAFGTTTGTARDVAHRIAREAYSFTFENSYTHYFRPRVLSMKEISVNYLISNWVNKNAMVIFVVSTTGQGEFPDDTKELWRELCGKSVPAVPIRFAAIGLGDSFYEMYNYPAKKLQNRLKQLSATSPFEVCLCDDQHDCGYAGALNPYLERCWRAWVPENCTTNPDSVPVARYNLVNIPVPGLQFNNQPRPTCDKLEQRMMIRNERVTDFDNFEDTRLIAFDTTNSNLNFQAGDVLQVFADNFPDNVQNFFKLYPQLRDQPPFYLVSVRSMRWVSIPAELFELCGPQPWTWETVATKIFDFQSIPGVYAFQILRSFATDPLIKEKFDEYCRPEGLDDLYNYTNGPRRTILEVLLDFRNTAVLVPPNYLFELIPFMRPRAFSIASPPCETQHIEILVAVVEYTTNLKTRRRGTCSHWLAEYCQIGQKVGVFCEKGSLRPPPNDAHVIMIGPGTGVAPFRSMIKQNLDKWDKHLFFGCRNKNIDFNFGQEFNEMVEKGQLGFYHAVSRDSAGRKLEYVQDLIVKQPNLFSSMMVSPLPIYIYVCGRAGQMPKDVRAAMQTVFSKIGINAAKHVINGMIEQGRYQVLMY